ncbi:hypothetical protein GCM10010176_065210 [Nonomuraea spiralis]|nr:hypothetical protein GCM10010176_065210 [Nonomuraea spiralis]
MSPIVPSDRASNADGMPETDSTDAHRPTDDADGTAPASPTLTQDEAATEPPDDTPEGFEPV